MPRLNKKLGTTAKSPRYPKCTQKILDLQKGANETLPLGRCRCIICHNLSQNPCHKTIQNAPEMDTSGPESSSTLLSKIPRWSAAHQVAQLGGLLGSLGKTSHITNRKHGKWGQPVVLSVKNDDWIANVYIIYVNNYAKNMYKALIVKHGHWRPRWSDRFDNGHNDHCPQPEAHMLISHTTSVSMSHSCLPNILATMPGSSANNLP